MELDFEIPLILPFHFKLFKFSSLLAIVFVPRGLLALPGNVGFAKNFDFHCKGNL